MSVSAIYTNYTLLLHQAHITSYKNKFRIGMKCVYLGFTPIIRYFDTGLNALDILLSG